MFRRVKSAGDEPLANQLRIEAEPNVLKSGKPGKSGKDESNELAWTGAVEPEDDEFEDELEEDEEGDEEDGRTDEERKAALQAELEREAEEYGLTGDNPVGLYGPNGQEVADLLDALSEIDIDTAEALADAYEAIPEPERHVAQSVVRRRHRGGKWEYELSLAERAVSDWISSLKLTDRDDVALYAIVANAATDAVDALILEEDLADADFATLYDAWSSVMDEDDEEAEGEAATGAGARGAKAPDDSADTAAADGAGAADEANGAEEDEEAGPFGPNTELVITFLNKLGVLDLAQTSALVDTWREQPKEELKVAHRAMQALADEDETWREQLRLAQDEVFAWMENRTTKYFEYGITTKDETRARELAGPAVADAIAALVLADMLETEEAEVLYAPWAEVVAEPELPTYEDDDEPEGDEE
jgi:hypothetical protein